MELVPCQSLRGSVPLRRKGTDSCKLGVDCRSRVVASPRMLASMFCLGDALKIFDEVVDRVSVLVMDVVSLRDRTMNRLPYLLVEMLDSSPDVATMGTIVHFVSPLF